MKLNKFFKRNRNIFIISGIILLGVIVTLFAVRPFSLYGNLGSISFKSYDPTTQTLVIDASVNLYGNNGVAGLMNTDIFTKEQCNFFGWDFHNPGDVGYVGATCGIYHPITDFSSRFDYTTNIQCTHSCSRCTLGTVSVSPSFDGGSIYYPYMNQFADDQISCSGTISVFPKIFTFYRFNSNTCSPINISESQKTSYDYSSLSECESHIVEQSKIYYRLQQNQCIQVSLLLSQVTESDYLNFLECNNAITHLECPSGCFFNSSEINGCTCPTEEKTNILIPILEILGVLILIIVLVFIYLKTRKR